MLSPRYFLILLAFIASLLFLKAKPEKLFCLSKTCLAATIFQKEKIVPKADQAFDEQCLRVYKVPAPLHSLSEEECREFPGGCVVEAMEVAGARAGQKIRMRVLKTDFKNPYIRTEEVIDSLSGKLVQRSEMSATHFLVRLPKGERPEAFLDQLGPDVLFLERVTTKDSLYQVQLKSHSLAALPRVFHEIKEKKLPVLSQEPDFLIHVSRAPNNPLYGNEQWYLKKTCWNINGPWDRRVFSSGIDACDAWDLRTSAESIVVAVIDSGIRYTHEDLAANMWYENNPTYGTIYGWNFYVKPNDVRESDPMDGLGHGTACAGIIGGVGDSGVGVAGVAWKVKLMALKFINDKGIGQVGDAVKAIDFAIEHGAQILNCSWGYVTPEEDQIFGGQFSDHKIPVDSQNALQAALTRARDLGVIVVAAAGNEGKNNDLYPEYPANYPLDNIVSVAATTEDNKLTEFSNYGAATVHLAAPGEEIFSTWARNDHDYICVQTRSEIFINDDLSSLNKEPRGTSFSAPQVVGALALLKAQFPTWTYQQLIQRVINTSDSILSLPEKEIIGGKLNVARALGDPIE